MSLKGRVVLVTGGSRGIGRAICVKMAELGADIVINYAGNETAAEQTALVCRSYGVEAMTLQCDIADHEKCNEMIKKIVDRFGKIDILINNAGITKDKLVMSMTEDDFDSVVNTNLKGTFNCIKFVSRYMIKQRYGRIINMSSVVGVRGNAGQVNYAASKAGVIGMTKSAAKELAGRNITVNAIAPGMIETDMTEVLSDKVKDFMLKDIPAKTIGKPEDIANAAAFFADEKSGYITGQVLCVDGGMAV